MGTETNSPGGGASVVPWCEKGATVMGMKPLLQSASTIVNPSVHRKTDHRLLDRTSRPCDQVPSSLRWHGHPGVPWFNRSTPQSCNEGCASSPEIDMSLGQLTSLGPSGEVFRSVQASYVRASASGTAAHQYRKQCRFSQREAPCERQETLTIAFVASRCVALWSWCINAPSFLMNLNGSIMV